MQNIIFNRKRRSSVEILPYLHWTLVAFSLLKKPITLKKKRISFKMRHNMHPHYAVTNGCAKAYKQIIPTRHNFLTHHRPAIRAESQIIKLSERIAGL